jgi:hypothetical protein
MPFSFRKQGSSVAIPMVGGPTPGLAAAAIVLASLAVACGSSGSSSGQGGAGGTTASGVAGSGSAGTTGRAGSTGTAGTGAVSSLPDLGKVCKADSECTGGTICLTATAKILNAAEGPANGYCSKACTHDSDCGSTGACLGVDSKLNGAQYCFQTCTFGGPPGTSKCHGRMDVGCLTLIDADATTTPPTPQLDVCLPICSQDSDCPGRKCDVGTGFCGDTAAPGDLLGSHCTIDPDGGASTCAGACLPIGGAMPGTRAASFCSMLCVLGSTNSCNWVGAGASLTSGGPHGVCALGAGNAEIGDIGFCTQECDTVADCSDKTDTGGMCDTTYMADIGHGYCSW